MLRQANARLEGKTLKQTHPHPSLSLAWLAWIVARLGGWKGYASEHKPDPITFLNGLKVINNIRKGWLLAHGTE